MENREGNKGKGCFRRDPFEGRSRKRSYEFHENVEEGAADVELNLGLSLNGRFGVDPKVPKILNPSSSVANYVLASEHKKMANEIQFPIIKTSSLPMETEEELRKKEEIQSLKYVDDDINKWDRMKKIIAVKETEEERRKKKEIQPLKYVDDDNNKWDRMKKIEVVKETDDENVHSSSHGGASGKILPSAGGSQGSSSSGPSGSITDVRPLVSGRPLERVPEQNLEQQLVATALETINEHSPIVSGKIGEETEGMLRNIRLTMPSVSTRGGIPNGTKIEGFLYGYKTGEDLNIVCVCHGAFLTPAEFIKHAGGDDVENPFKHITIEPAPLY